MISRSIHDAEREEFEGDKLERTFDECPSEMTGGDYDDMSPQDKIDVCITDQEIFDETPSDQLLAKVQDLSNVDDDSPTSALTHYILADTTDYIVENRRLGSTEDWECKFCKFRNYEGSAACAECGRSYEDHLKLKY
jgi:hypothetical protein